MKTKTLNRISRNGTKRLLVPVDFSHPSFLALRHAIDLAENFGGATLRILYVVPADNGWLNIGREEFHELDKSLQKQAGEELRALAQTHVPPTVHVDLEVRIGRPAEEIVAAANEASCDLIVLSTHGRTGFERYLIGSVAERVMRLAPCPVYLIPALQPRQTNEPARAEILRTTRCA